MAEKLEDKKRWSEKEKIAAGLLLSVLGPSSVLLGLMLYAGNMGCCAFGPEPCPRVEVLNIVSSTLNSPTNVTMKIINSGTKAATLQSYYVKNSTGQLYSSTNWAGPTISPNTVAFVNILIDGRAFTFQVRYAYTMTLITSRYQFTFTVQA